MKLTFDRGTLLLQGKAPGVEPTASNPEKPRHYAPLHHNPQTSRKRIKSV
jgi:hypothetical protein